MYLWEAEAQFNVRRAKENWLVWEGDPGVIYVNVEAHIGHAKGDGLLVFNWSYLVHCNVCWDTGSGPVVR